MSPKKQPKLYERIMRCVPHLAKMWKVDTGYASPHEESAWAQFENLIHEMAHAEDLGMSIGVRLSTRITNREPSQEAEARTLAIEWYVFKLLRAPIEKSFLVGTADLQNITADELEEHITGKPSIRTKVLARKIVRRLKLEERAWVYAGRPGHVPRQSKTTKD